MDVIKLVDEPTDQVSQYVTKIKKSDPGQLDKAMKYELYQLPIIQEVVPKLGQAKVFINQICHQAIGTSNYMSVKLPDNI